MFFNFFKKDPKPTSPTDDSDSSEVLASLSFIITSDSESPAVDIELKDYDDECIKALCSLIDVLAQERSLIETVNIIKTAMIKDGKEDYLIDIFSHISNSTKSKMLSAYKDKDTDEPCVKPSEVFMK